MTSTPLPEQGVNPIKSEDELARLYDCPFCDGEQKVWNIKTDEYETCSCVEKIKAIKAHYARQKADTLDFAKEVILQWGYEPVEGIYTSGGLSTLETAFSILRQHGLLNENGQWDTKLTPQAEQE